MPKVMIRELEKLDFRTKEAYKTLRTNLSFIGKDFRVISLTSCTPNEGKSSVSFQLALSLVEDGKRTILVDADLRKSVLRRRYRAGHEKYGLSPLPERAGGDGGSGLRDQRAQLRYHFCGPGAAESQRTSGKREVSRAFAGTPERLRLRHRGHPRRWAASSTGPSSPGRATARCW